LDLNAGFTFDKMLHTTTDEGYELMLKVHNVAPFRLIREAAPYMRKKDGGKSNRSIITVSSVAGLHGNVGQAKYVFLRIFLVVVSSSLKTDLSLFFSSLSLSATLPPKPVSSVSPRPSRRSGVSNHSSSSFHLNFS
jgi:NAD(P)-dependent dehydrogenase (short-subunit alcohol dehydrogenase family)